MCWGKSIALLVANKCNSLHVGCCRHLNDLVAHGRRTPERQCPKRQKTRANMENQTSIALWQPWATLTTKMLVPTWKIKHEATATTSIALRTTLSNPDTTSIALWQPWATLTRHQSNTRRRRRHQLRCGNPEQPWQTKKHVPTWKIKSEACNICVL